MAQGGIYVQRHHTGALWDVVGGPVWEVTWVGTCKHGNGHRLSFIWPSAPLAAPPALPHPFLPTPQPALLRGNGAIWPHAPLAAPPALPQPALAAPPALPHLVLRHSKCPGGRHCLPLRPGGSSGYIGGFDTTILSAGHSMCVVMQDRQAVDALRVLRRAQTRDTGVVVQNHQAAGAMHVLRMAQATSHRCYHTEPPGSWGNASAAQGISHKPQVLPCRTARQFA